MYVVVGRHGGVRSEEKPPFSGALIVNILPSDSPVALETRKKKQHLVFQRRNKTTYIQTIISHGTMARRPTRLCSTI